MKEDNKEKQNLLNDNAPLPGIQTIINDNRLTQIREDGTTVYNLKNVIRVISIVILSIILALLIIFAATVIADYKQAFPVTVGSEHGEITLSLSSDMADPTTHLDMPVTEQIGDFSQHSIPPEIDSLGGGEHNSNKGYLAYTFFLQNNTDHTIDVDEVITIISSTRHVEDALRIRVYRNGVATTYAALDKNGVPEYGTNPFSDKTTPVDQTTTVGEGDIIRYTIVVWLEGSDPECVNDISGGTVRLSMSFTTGRS